MTLDEARLLANVKERAERLFADGYRAERNRDDSVEIHSPEGASYAIDTLFETCTCPFYARFSGRHACKHLRGYPKLLQDQERAARELQLQQRLPLIGATAPTEALPIAEVTP